METIVRPKTHSSLMAGLLCGDLSSMRRFVETISSSRYPERNVAIALLRFLLRLSATEISQLNLPDLYDYEGHLYVAGAHRRLVQLPDAASLAIERWLQIRGDQGGNEILFSSERTERMTISGIRQVLGELQAVLPGKRGGIRLLVAAFANLYLAMDGDLEMLRLALGCTVRRQKAGTYANTVAFTNDT